ncbi:S1C family serine protease [Candidatus Woesearchaeota archaeon]|nr:S1C family serine protease [Candidatus Woesearchaeota archaeon]
MKKDLVSVIAAATLLLGGAATQSGCTTMLERAKVNNAIEHRERSLRSDLEEIAKSVHCIRQTVEYRKAGAAPGSPTETKTWFGTAFAYTKRDGYTYLVTNHHVVDSPKEIPILKIMPGVLTIDNYVKVSEKLELVDDRHDTKKEDDIAVEKVDSTKVPDAAVIRTRSNLYVASSYIRDDTIRPKRWEDAYVVGFPAAMFQNGTKGIVSQPGYAWPKEGIVDVLDLHVLGGNSGSPYFIRRGNDLYWGGIIEAHMGGNGSALTIGVPLREFSGMLTKYSQSPVVVPRGDAKKR